MDAKKNKRNRKTAEKPAEPPVLHGSSTYAINEEEEVLFVSEAAAQFQTIRHDLGVNQVDMQRLAHLSIRSISALETGEKSPTAADYRRYRELERLREALGKVVNGRVIPQWLKTPNKLFDGLTPLEVIERGEIDRIWRMIHRLEDGGFA